MAMAQAAQQKIRIKLKSYHVDLINQACDEIKGVVSETGATLSGPVPMPMNKKVREAAWRVFDGMPGASGEHLYESVSLRLYRRESWTSFVLPSPPATNILYNHPALYAILFHPLRFTASSVRPT